MPVAAVRGPMHPDAAGDLRRRIHHNSVSQRVERVIVFFDRIFVGVP
jgi:hypothetical protein